MRIAAAKNPHKAPTTRRALLAHLWACGLTDVNIWREGPQYVLQAGRVLTATGLRRITARTFAEWERFAKTAPRQRTDYC